jgi:hypothetical protein
MSDSFRREVDMVYRRIVSGGGRVSSQRSIVMMGKEIAGELLGIAREVAASSTDIVMTKNAIVGRAERVVEAVNRRSVLITLGVRLNRMNRRDNWMLVTFTPHWKEDQFVNSANHIQEIPVSSTYRKFVENVVHSSFGDVEVSWKDDIGWIQVPYEE